MSNATLHSTPKPRYTRFDRLVAFTVYDGPISGLVFAQLSREVFYFRLLAWDAQQRQRVFSLAAVEPSRANAVIDQLIAHESPYWPEWWVQSAPGSTPAITSIVASRGPDVAVLITADLLGDTHQWLDITPLNREEFEQLSARESEDDEVAAASFERWESFLAR